MIIKKTNIQTENIKLIAEEDGKQLRKMIENFKSGIDDDLDTLVFLIKQNETHDVFYTISFALDDSDEDNVYRDVFIGCRIIDYTDEENLFIEVEESHEQDCPFADELYEQLEKQPCTTLHEIKKQGFKDYYSNGFRAADRTKFEARIQMLGD